jgi:hypothetical protein
MTGRNRILIYGPKDDGTYLIEFMTTDRDALAISIPRSQAHVVVRTPYGARPKSDTGLSSQRCGGHGSPVNTLSTKRPLQN